MPSRIRIGPDGGPYVIVEENNGDLDITTPDNTIDLQNSGLINAALSGVLDAQNNDISNVGALTADSVNTENVANDWHYAGAYDGGDADTRLDAAISAADSGDKVHLENATYTSDRTISKALIISGPSVAFFGGVQIDAAWTLTARITVENVAVAGASGQDEITTEERCRLLNLDCGGDTTIQVNGDRTLIGMLENGTVNFATGTSGGVVDFSSNVTVNDNGTNTTGTIA